LEEEEGSLRMRVGKKARSGQENRTNGSLALEGMEHQPSDLQADQKDREARIKRKRINDVLILQTLTRHPDHQSRT
jgi:hypothetical protein